MPWKPRWLYNSGASRANPKRLNELLNQNPSVVFFRELPLGDPAAGPVGALGVPLTRGGNGSGTGHSSGPSLGPGARQHQRPAPQLQPHRFIKVRIEAHAIALHRT